MKLELKNDAAVCGRFLNNFISFVLLTSSLESSSDSLSSEFPHSSLLLSSDLPSADVGDESKMRMRQKILSIVSVTNVFILVFFAAKKQL